MASGSVASGSVAHGLALHLCLRLELLASAHGRAEALPSPPTPLLSGYSPGTALKNVHFHHFLHLESVGETFQHEICQVSMRHVLPPPEPASPWHSALKGLLASARPAPSFGLGLSGRERGGAEGPSITGFQSHRTSGAHCSEPQLPYPRMKVTGRKEWPRVSSSGAGAA